MISSSVYVGQVLLPDCFGDMFSLVTALVSPCVIELLAHKKEALVATLQENASVVCSHPADSVCLLQGEWDNVKKAYAIVEEFYLRAQAESVVRRMMKVEPGSDARPDFSSAPANVIGGRIPPDQVLSLLLSPPPTDEGEQTAVGRSDDARRSPKHSHRSLSPDTQSSIAHQQRVFAFSQSVNGITTTATVAGDVAVGNPQRPVTGASCRSTRSHDDSPPILSREGNVDEISDESDTSESQHGVGIQPGGGSAPGLQQCQPESTLMTHVNGPKATAAAANAPEDVARSAAAAGSTNFGHHPENVNMVSSSRRLEHPLPVAAVAASRGQLFPGSEFFGHMQPSCHHQPVPPPPPGADSDGAVARLPQIASLFSGVGGGGGGALSAAAWPYAELYSAHLSAMRSICESTVKRESAVDPAGYGADRGRAVPMSGGTVAGDGYRPEDDPLAPEMRCSRCDKRYRSEARMREHARTHDAGYVAVLHACPKCGKAFTYRHNMVVHLRRFHYGWQPAKRHACRTCGMRFQKPYLLRLHERKAHLPSQMDSDVALHR